MDLNKQWQEYAGLHTYGHPEHMMEDLGWSVVEQEIADTWRWGNIVRVVWKSPEGQLVGAQFMDASGDGDIDADGMNVEFYPVEAQEVTITKYVKVT